MIEKIVSKYLNVELFEIIQGKNEIELTLHDYLDKGIKFENDVESIVNELRKIYSLEDGEEIDEELYGIMIKDYNSLL